MASLRPLFPALLALIIGAVALWSGIAPFSRAVWYAEVAPIFIVFAALLLSYSRFRFSNCAYFLMSLWMILHLIGAHYTFELVPFDWANALLSPWLGENRNHFDRVAHYIIGFYSFPMAEFLLRRKLAGPILSGFFALFFIMSVAAAYEIIEWQYAVLEGGEAGIAFLGSQGDIWDAQKDMLADTLGAITALIIFYLRRPDKRYS
ncbi:putative membrane protein [Mesocricetibacter intestinalis]|uniref:Putative membrane protein n=1 Tax=Mesocricetibacter intestinalis TaxID=1521930 RepID=A0A4R6VC99_9PAST|nr:putative membrane protein [Mesocricetibacter intestinalis]